MSNKNIQFLFEFNDYSKSKDGTSQILKFENFSSIKIGKDPKSHIYIDEKNMSRMHSVIECDDYNLLTIIDLGNEPGTFVNKARINKYQLKREDVINFGGKSYLIYKGFENSNAEMVGDIVQDKLFTIKPSSNAMTKIYNDIKSKKIYITAAHSCGKSTLARYIANQYKMNFISEVARMVLSEKELSLKTLRSNLDIVDDYQWSVFERQLEEESKYESFVSDRCFDFLAYSAQHAMISAKIFNDERFQNYIKSLKNDNVIIFFVRPSKATLSNDGIRENPDWDSVVAIDAQIKLILEMFGIRYFQINSDSLQERTRIIDNIFSLLLTK